MIRTDQKLGLPVSLVAGDLSWVLGYVGGDPALPPMVRSKVERVQDAIYAALEAE